MLEPKVFVFIWVLSFLKFLKFRLCEQGEAAEMTPNENDIR